MTQYPKLLGSKDSQRNVWVENGSEKQVKKLTTIAPLDWPRHTLKNKLLFGVLAA